MKIIPKITVLAALLGTTPLILAQTSETIPTSMESVTDNDDDGGKWGLAGLLGLLGLIGLRRNRDAHHDVRGTNTH